MPGVSLVPLGNLPEGLLARLERRIGSVFRVSVTNQAPPVDLSVAFDAYRNQYNSTILLSLLLKHSDAPANRILGVTAYDLHVPVLTFVFGEAQLSGKAAVVSLFRLRPEFYGLPENENLLEARLAKEAIHELGHTYGLVHCSNPRCVMHSSTYAEDIDLKESDFCAACASKIFAEN
jgi:archaemetzincin